MSTASSTDGSSSVVAIGPVWPPPSPPWTITASAPQPATFFACLARPTDGITTTPASLSFAIRSGLGANANDATLTPSRISRSMRSFASPASARMLMPNGLSVAALTLVTAVAVRPASSSPRRGCQARRRWRWPTPAAHPPPSPSRSAPPDARCRPARSAAYAAWSWLYLDFLVPQCLRIDDLADKLLLVGRWEAASSRRSPGRVPRRRCSRPPARPRCRDAATPRASGGPAR